MSQSKSLQFVGNAFELEKQSATRPSKLTMWTRQELDIILSLYGRHVADGRWRDYGIDVREIPPAAKGRQVQHHQSGMSQLSPACDWPSHQAR